MFRAHLANLRLVLLSLALTCCAATALTADVNERDSRSTAGFVNQRGTDTRRDPLTLESRPQTSRLAAPRKSRIAKSAQTLAANCCAFWVYSADTELFDDFDGDGYYTYLRVVFDVDTVYFDADVYADVYLAPVGESWELIYESDVFTIFGSSADDLYEVETEFVAGYPPADYDVLIDVYDAATGEFVASFGPADSSALSYLPIEDISYDTDTATQVVISSGGGGSISAAGLLLLAGLAYGRARRRINESA